VKMDNAVLFSDSFSVRLILDTFSVRLILDTYRSDQFTIVKSVGEHQPSLSPLPKFFVRFSLPPGISMSGLEKISLNDQQMPEYACSKLSRVVFVQLCSTVLRSFWVLLSMVLCVERITWSYNEKLLLIISNPLLYSIPVSAQALPFTTSIVALLSALRASFLSRLRSIPLCPVSAVKAVDAVEAVEHIFLST